MNILKWYLTYCKASALKTLSVLFLTIVNSPFWLQRIVRNIQSFQMVTSVKAVGKYCSHFTLTDLMLRLDTLWSHRFAQPICSCSCISSEILLFLRLYGLSECVISPVLPPNRWTSSFTLYIMECLSWDSFLFISKHVNPVSTTNFHFKEPGIWEPVPCCSMPCMYPSMQSIRLLQSLEEIALICGIARCVSIEAFAV